MGDSPNRPETARFREYRLRAVWTAWLPLTLCTDNPGISRTTLADEYLTASRMMGGLSVWDALAMMRQGFLHAFLPATEREWLLKDTDARVYRAVLERFTEMRCRVTGQGRGIRRIRIVGLP